MNLQIKNAHQIFCRKVAQQYLPLFYFINSNDSPSKGDLNIIFMLPTESKATWRSIYLSKVFVSYYITSVVIRNLAFNNPFELELVLLKITQQKVQKKPIVQ